MHLSIITNKHCKNHSPFHKWEESKIDLNLKISKFHKKLFKAAETNDIMFIKQNSWLLRKKNRFKLYWSKRKFTSIYCC